MNANDLFQIVKDLPREAWPEMVQWLDTYQTPIWWLRGGVACPAAGEDGADVFVRLFEASLMRWMVLWSHDHEEGPVHQAIEDMAYRVGTGHGTWYSGTSLVEALALAVKVVSQ